MPVLLRRAGETAVYGIGGKLGESGGPLTWRPVVWKDKEKAREWMSVAYLETRALVTCHLGHELRLTPRIHTVDPDGTVHPSWVCTHPACPFHEFIKLEDWNG
jgi:hypothetical protein